MACLRLCALLLITAGIRYVSCKRFHSIAGPYRINFKRFELCYQGDKNRDDVLNISMREFRYNRERRYNGSFTLPFPFNDSISAVLDFAVWNGNRGWQENAYTFRADVACVVIEKWFRSIWTKFMNSMFGEFITCPHFPGYYWFDQVKVTSSDLPVKHFFYGSFKARLLFFHRKNNKECGCIKAFVDIIPI